MSLHILYGFFYVRIAVASGPYNQLQRNYHRVCARLLAEWGEDQLEAVGWHHYWMFWYGVHSQ